jgi:hypothetical protein
MLLVTSTECRAIAESEGGPASPVQFCTARRPKKPAELPKELAAAASEPSTSPGIDNKGGPRHRREATKENCVEHPTKPTERHPWHIGTQPYLRLALARRALTLTRFQMARLIGADVLTWATYEAGLQRKVEQALKLSTYVTGAHNRPAPAHLRQNSPARKLEAKGTFRKSPAGGRG